MLNFLIFVFCVMIFVLGMIGLSKYPDASAKKVPSKSQRIVFSSVVGFALGLAPVMFVLGTWACGVAGGANMGRILFGFMSIVSFIAWIYCAVLLSDRDALQLSHGEKAFVGTMLAVLILAWGGFGFLAYRGGNMLMSMPSSMSSMLPGMSSMSVMPSSSMPGMSPMSPMASMPSSMTSSFRMPSFRR